MLFVPTLARTLLLAALLGAAATAEAQSWRTVTSARQAAGGEEALDVQVEYGAGRLTVGPASRPLLYQLRVRYDEEQFAPVTAYDPVTGRLRLGVRGRGGKGAKVSRVSDESSAAVHLSREVPLALDLKFGAGEADVDLGGMSIRSLRVSTGASETRISFGSPNRVPADAVRIEAGAASLRASGLGNARAARFQFEGGVGETTLDFDGAWTRSATATVQMGIGSLRLRLPRDLGVKIVKQSFMTRFDADGLVKRGGAHYSRNWESAPYRLTISIEAALGSIDVDWIE